MTRGVEQLRDWSRRFASVDPIAADVAELFTHLEAMRRRAEAAEGDWQAFEQLAESRLVDVEALREELYDANVFNWSITLERLERVKSTAIHLWQAIDRAHVGGETFPLEISVAGARLQEALALSDARGTVHNKVAAADELAKAVRLACPREHERRAYDYEVAFQDVRAAVDAYEALK